MITTVFYKGLLAGPQMSGATPGLATTGSSRDQAEEVDGEVAVAGRIVARIATDKPRLPVIPDMDGLRFCRACQALLPVELFPAGARRYICRRHLWERVQLPSKLRLMANPRKKLRWILWKRCWMDAKAIFGQPRISLLQNDIERILAKKLQRLPDATEELPAELNKQSLMPADPARQLSRDNAVLVPSVVRKHLLKARRDGGRALYLETLAALR